jgi:ABC-type multidrug transport system fused ATPase/permease subunit
MTTSILEALIQLFALFAAGQDKNGVDLGRTHAARYMRIQLPKAWADESLERFDELVNQFQRVTGSGEEVRAKRLAKLSVKLLRTCSQINKGLEWHEKHVVVVRLMEYLAQVQDHETGTHFLKTVCDSFALSDEAVGALESMVGAPVSKSRQELPQLFELTDSFLNGRFGGKVIGFHLEEGNLFLLRTASDDVIRVNHQEMPNHAVALLAPGGTLRDGTGSTLFHSELIAHIQRKQDQSEPISLQASNVSHYFQFPSNQALHQFNLEAEGGQLVGIMGGSGSGKSTMLSILNGSVKPSFG